MKDLKEYIKESILDDIDDQIENTDEIIKNNITNWLKENVRSIQDNKLKFDFNTTPITVDYDGDIDFKTNTMSLMNGMFQWGEIGGYFNCSFCKSLESLKGAPKIVSDLFWCNYCPLLKSLEGSPKEVGGNFSCSDCKSLKSLKGSPLKVRGHFNCNYCPLLKSLEGAPKEVGGNFDCNDCGTKFTKDDVKKICKVKGKIYC